MATQSAYPSPLVASIVPRNHADYQCLASGTSGEDFALEVDRAITDFADYERPKHLAAARRVASAEQKAALRRLPKRERR